MRMGLKIALTVSLALSLANTAQAETYVYNGKELRQMQQAYERAMAGESSSEAGVLSGMYMGYIAGVLDALKNARVVCSKNNVSLDQAMQTISNYLNNNPDKWSMSAHELVAVPLANTFPCE